MAGSMKESIQRAFSYIESHKVTMGIGQEFDTSDFHVEAIDLLSNRIPADSGVAFITAVYSAIRSHPARPGVVILGDISIQGNIKPLSSLIEVLQNTMDNGGNPLLFRWRISGCSLRYPGIFSNRLTQSFMGIQ
ncbi:MAG: S16 family serine protease [Methanobacteriota archaeon]